MAASNSRSPEIGPVWAWEWRRNRIHPFAPPAAESAPFGAAAARQEAEDYANERIPAEYVEMDAIIQNEYPQWPHTR